MADPRAFHVELGGSATRGTREAPPAPDARPSDSTRPEADVRARRRPGRRPVRVPEAPPGRRRPPGADRRLRRHAGRRPPAREPRVHGARAQRRLRASAPPRGRCGYVVRAVAYSDDGIQSRPVARGAPARRGLAAMGDEHFDAVVVGSGFGGSVTAFRLSEAGMRVCLLERGKAYPPGSFPRSPLAVARSLWDPSEGLHGLFNVWEFSGLGGIVASGLGGGSLLYSNILLRKDRSTFVQEDLDCGRLGELAGDVRRPRAALRAPRDDARGGAVPDGARPVRRDTEDRRAPRGRRHASGSSGSCPKLAITFAPDGGAARARRADPRRGAEPPRSRAPDVPPLRRVQLRLQLRLEVHARLQLPLVREAPARSRHPHAVRGEDVRAAARAAAT